MEYAKNQNRTTRSTRTNRSTRRTLRREVPSTVGLLADPEDFEAMRAYRTFTFDNHRAYLQQVDHLLKTLSAEGLHTSVALFDPEEFEEFCTSTGLDPDRPETRARFTAHVAARGTCVPYTGEPLDQLIHVLVDEAVRQATWDCATLLLSDLGNCAGCGEDIGKEAFERSSHLLVALLKGAGRGIHHLVCSVPAESEQLLSVLHAEAGADGVPELNDDEGAEFVTVLAAGIALESPGGVVLRTTREGQPDRVHGWRLDRGGLTALTEAEVFNAYCTDAETGEPVSPESGVEYCAGFVLDDPGTGHH
ncbi:hypothetical protein GCM10010329_86280 [Streptomyces spiroverticillatus]|uniref:Uncharacterized protein n=1 Tax=Streptomyces finlayi TaxID=67296 RepID=A0A918X802_9ACTN|nr:hypothetical protein [Streptomyces finlayi]GHA51117.1 hypothetical protein GCM10010329_86280 [Streptomyces spiroverticillatus]GHD17432.1 hypothetical protein GCM10010334_79350 [Streptomyces finlayi]